MLNSVVLNVKISFQATDNEGEGLSTVVSLKISLTDSNDNPPRFLYHNYRTVVDEGAAKFEPTLQVQVVIYANPYVVVKFMNQQLIFSGRGLGQKFSNQLLYHWR